MSESIFSEQTTDQSHHEEFRQLMSRRINGHASELTTSSFHTPGAELALDKFLSALGILVQVGRISDETAKEVISAIQQDAIPCRKCTDPLQKYEKFKDFPLPL